MKNTKLSPNTSTKRSPNINDNSNNNGKNNNHESNNNNNNNQMLKNTNL